MAKSLMPDLKDRLARYRQIKITVIGRKSGKTGRQSQFRSGSCWKAKSSFCCQCWARSPSGTRTCSRTRRFELMRGVWKKTLRAIPITDAHTVQSVIEKFREKYGAKDVKKYYSKFDVAMAVELDRISK